jgi:hypothetical protein
MTQVVDDRDKSAGKQAVGRGSVALRALTGGAVALPGIAGPALADSPIDKPRGDFSFSRYQEASVDSSDVAVGDSDRYEINIYQINLAAPIDETKDVSLDLAVETMSGASPWAIVPDDDGELKLLMSEASIEDTRVDALLSGNFYNPLGKSTLSGGVSIEEDYRAVNVGASIERSFQSKHTTLSGGLAISVDEVDPVNEHDNFTFDSQFFEDRDKDYKQGYSGNFGISRIINRYSIIQSSVTYKHARGYLDDPYKLVFFDDIGTFRADRRPDSRDQVSWLTRYRRHSPRFFGTLHLDYQFYWDSWDVTSHTAEVAWYQDVFDWFQFVPSFRYYTQAEADFYRPYFENVPNKDEYSSDYRLSSFGAIAARAKLVSHKLEWGRFQFEGNVGGEWYRADADWGLSNSDFDDNPGLVEYWVVSAALTGRF